MSTPRPTLSRRGALFLVGVAVWNVLTYTMFTKNLFFGSADSPDRPTGYYVAHSVLIVVNLLIAAVLAPMGWRAYQAHRSGGAPDRTRAPEVDARL